MDIALIIIGFIMIIAGIIGCILPVIPGPPLSYLGLILLHFTSYTDLSIFMLIFTGTAAIISTILDYYVPIWGTKKAGGTKWGIRGSALGLIAGLFFAPLGILIGPFIGAFLGEILYRNNISSKVEKKTDNFSNSLKAALGSFLGLMFGIALKLAVSCFIAFIFVKEIIIAMF